MRFGKISWLIGSNAVISCLIVLLHVVLELFLRSPAVKVDLVTSHVEDIRVEHFQPFFEHVAEQLIDFLVQDVEL